MKSTCINVWDVNQTQILDVKNQFKKNQTRVTYKKYKQARKFNWRFLLHLSIPKKTKPTSG